jgi:imidazolonepropionase
MPVLVHVGVLYACLPDGGQGDVHPIRDAALAFRGGRVTWVGPASALPASEDDGARWDAGGAMVIPGLVDCHTHLAFGGWRADEFVRRIRGATYEEIARAGGGIASTVARTRAMTTPEILARCRGFLREMLSLGVTTIEAKSGYGLDAETELRLLEAYRALDAEGPVRIVPTYLGAHVVPPEHRADRAAYVAFVAERMIPRVAREGLARFADVFVEEGAFSAEEARTILGAAWRAGLGLKVHADQLSDAGAAALAAEVGAISADHLERASAAGIAALARAGVVAVSLPVAALYLRRPPLDARPLVDAGVRVAVATDFNPGTAPTYHFPLALTLACTQQRLTPAEALKGGTTYAARAVGLEAEVGALAPGRAADFAIVDAPDVESWLYHFRPNACLLTAARGAVGWRAPGFSETPRAIP